MCGNYSREETIQGRKLYEEMGISNSMNNLLSYCGLVDPRISASDKDSHTVFPHIVSALE